MPTRQDTFKLVPTTLVNKIAPRPPMTSKAAKKAYREANKLPKISKAEQRRIEAAEIARQKKEYEKEKAAAKAKIAREKKLKKEAEERAKRKELGLPEPSRFVRPSQPTIKAFVKSAGGQKRAWEEANSQKDVDSDTAVEGVSDERLSEEAIENPEKRMALNKEEEDEFGDFPSLSQADLPTLFAEPHETSRTVPIESSRSRLTINGLKSQPLQCEAVDHILITDQVNIDAEMLESQLAVKATPSTTTVPSKCNCRPSAVSPETVTSPYDIDKESCAQLSSTSSKRLLPSTMTPTILIKSPRKSVNEGPRTMQPPAIPMTVNRMRLRTPLNETLQSMAPPPRPARIQAITSTKRPKTRSEEILVRGNFSIPPSSTLAFLEAHLDDFFPSPSQQVRELLNEIDDMPSNTQIAREIDLDDQDCIPVRVPHVPSPLPLSQTRIEDEALHFLSSQDLEISSQNLRDIDTPSKAVPKGSPSRKFTTQNFAFTEITSKPSPTPKLKPRFFEEKEDDLLHAALHESLLLSKQTTQGSSPRRSQRILCRIQPTKTDHSYDDYGFEGSDLDAELLALLDDP